MQPLADFEVWPFPSPVLDRLGPFHRHRTDHLRVGFRVVDHQLNARGFLHAGVLATLADVAIGHGLSALSQPPRRAVTVNLTCDYHGSATTGAWVDGIVTPAHIGRRLSSGRIEFTVDGRTIAAARGMYMIVESTA
jgi:acyl-coenzyme A thioesterase 13